MPFRSQAQRRFMYSQKPNVAKRWRKKSGPQRGLPERSTDPRAQLIRQFLHKHGHGHGH